MQRHPDDATVAGARAATVGLAVAAMAGAATEDSQVLSARDDSLALRRWYLWISRSLRHAVHFQKLELLWVKV